MTKKLYFNGNVITVNNKEEVVQAVAIEDGKIIKVGTNEEILSLKDNDTEVIDLEGKTMLPGFIDPHGHIVPVAQTLMIVTLGDVTSKEELLARLEESLKNDPPSGDNWLIGFGYDNTKFEDGEHPTKFDLDKALARAHILEGLRIAIDNIDEVIKIIRESYDDAKERLMERFGLDDIQAQAILDMRLRTLQGLQREKIEEEYEALMKLIAHLREILASEKLVFDIIKEECLEMKEKYGDERLTKIVAAPGEFNDEDLIKEEDSIIALTRFGYIKRMPQDTYKSQRRGGKGITGMTTREDDFVKQIFSASTHDIILFFSNKGKLYRLRGFEIPEAGRTAKGTAIVNLLSLDAGEKITAVIPIKNFEDGKFLLMATKTGLVKKTALVEYDSARKTGLQAINLKEDDELIDVRLSDGDNNIVLVTKKGMCITFSEKDTRPVGRTAQGVIGIKLDKEDIVIGMETITEGKSGTLLAITENGFGKRTELEEYRVQTRAGKGVITYKVTSKTGDIIGIRITNEEEDVMMITDTGTVIRIKAKEISVLGRNTQGVTLMRTNDGGKVVSIETINEEDTNIEE